MLSFEAKTLILGNTVVLNYCKSNDLDVNKLAKCRIEKMGNNFVVGLPKEDSEFLKPTMENDIATQPDVVLIISVETNGKIIIKPTKYTVRLLNT